MRKKYPYRYSLLEMVILVLEIHSQIVHSWVTWEASLFLSHSNLQLNYDCLSRGNLFRGINIWSGAVYKGIKSPFQKSFVTLHCIIFFSNYAERTKLNYEIINKLFYKN